MKPPAPPQADPDAPERTVREHHESDGSVRETLESIVIAFVLAFIFRAFIVEAFVIPTGSMAPTLLGQHVTITCPQCGYRFVAGPRDSSWDQSQSANVAEPVQGVNRALELACPMCDNPIERRAVRTDAGDRILVLKYLYAFSQPRRWDVVVFKNPQQPAVNYIKRLVGLPGEQLWIVNGNVYTRPLKPDGGPDDSAPWQIQRKADRPEVQNSVWRPLYHSDYFPLDGGGPDRGARGANWEIPWQPTRPTDWSMEHGIRWHWLGTKAATGGTLNFEFAQNPHYAFNFHSYNILESRGPFDAEDGQSTIEEMRIAVTAMPEQPGADLSLTSSGLNILVRGRIDPQGNVTLETAPRGPSPPGDTDPPVWQMRAQAKTTPLPAHRGTRIELWHVDQSLSMWVGGRRIVEWRYDLKDIGLSLADLAAGSTQHQLPIARIEVAGSPIVLRSIDLDRDLYYTQAHRYDSPGRGTFNGPATIQANNFLCLGDNSPSSLDGRMWTTVDPWVTNVRDVPPGFVPREMMIGRAFFVYYPATHHLPASPLGLPNFGDMRFIR